MMARRPAFRACALLASLALPSLAGWMRSASAPSPTTIGDAPGAQPEALRGAIDAMFDDAAAGETRAVVVMHDGRIVAERYAPGFGPRTRQIGWSLSKCVTGLLIGLLVSDGRLQLDAPAPIPAWNRSGDPRGAITPRMLLQMRAGLRHVESTRPVEAADTVKMLFLEGRDDMAGYAETQPLDDRAGARFRYSTANAVILNDIAARVLAPEGSATARREAVAAFAQSRLFDPAGLASMTAEYDAAGTMAGGSMIWATPRDWARLGELLRGEGALGGAQIVPQRWVRFMRTPSPANPGYGAQLWLNAGTGKTSSLFPGRAPADLFACRGYRGQYVIVSPSQRLTLVRLGMSRTEPNLRLRERLLAIVRLFPGG